jgi:hypothetical protein
MILSLKKNSTIPYAVYKKTMYWNIFPTFAYKKLNILIIND